ncbi:NitT/TauT family transport system substrate-binding protein [Mariprofundus aestuarium]|uniref:NitT/TauT family transport system substrate-binding protein n=1 Tax=Mariprofundus aestuarium TaxID=1921086 RepID=A0A2K8KXQ6_MARES|nr:ABC transporter substrate-binding protein [Mariprofundus aestuarium]ATX79727.1 NitT/TauT family transport system substrate-binding protein [Mariprofundus aestuarium]
MVCRGFIASLNQGRSWIVLPLLLLCLFSLTTCSRDGLNSTPITIGINSWAGYDPFILADKLDLFNKNNVQVEIRRFASTTEQAQAMRDGEIQGAGLTLDEVFSLVGAGFKGKVVLIVDYSMGGDMVIGQKEIKSIAELKGKTIGYEGSVVGGFLLDRALYKYNLKRSAVKLIDVQADKWHDSFVEKNVDALVCFNPVATELLNEHEGNLLFSSADIPFEIIDVLLFSESFYHDNKPAITKILRAWFETLSYIDTNLDKAAEIISAVKNTTPDNYKQGLNSLVAPDLTANRAVFDPTSDKNIYKYSQAIVDFMMSKNMLSKRIHTAGLFESEVLLEIQNPAVYSR